MDFSLQFTKEHNNVFNDTRMKKDNNTYTYIHTFKHLKIYNEHYCINVR